MVWIFSDAAGRLKSDRQILFVLLGSGREKDRLQKKAADAELTISSLLTAFPKRVAGLGGRV